MYEILQTPYKLFNEIDITNIQNDFEKQHEMYINILNKINDTRFSTTGSALADNENDFLNNYFKNKGIKITEREYDILTLINSKNTIGYVIWFILLGFVAVMISTNMLLNTDCNGIF